MLRAALVVCLLSLVGLGVRAQGPDTPEGMHRPERLTVGIADQFLGQLSPDESTLYFVSSQETRKEIYAQDGEEGRTHMVFDEGADVTWPRVSPDGKRLLYISFSDQATGQLCVRDLPKGNHRRCLENDAAALQAEWIDKQHIAMIGRTSIDGDLSVSRVLVGQRLAARTLFEKNWTNPAISPDGRWLVYIPLDRMARLVGPGFAARATRRLEAIRLDKPAASSVPLALDLPGLTSQPAFAGDGRSLYFVQFFSDSNHDGTIDASDHGVLFRVPWAAAADDAPAQAATAAPRQLTDSGSDCQYPAPAAHRLITTCLRGKDLDIYELPLDGAIPSDWTGERIRAELALGARREEQLLLYRHALGHASTVSWQRLIAMRLVMAHLEVEEFDAAEFYAEKIHAQHDPATRGIGQPLLALVAHRRARSAQERGRMADSVAEEAREVTDALADEPTDTPAARVLNHVVLSELADSLGDKFEARRQLESAILDDQTPRAVIEAYLSRADALYRGLDDRAASVAVYRRFATSPALTPDHRLEYARATVRALTRGLPFDEAYAVLTFELSRAPADSELSFALTLMQATLAIRDGQPHPELRAALVSLYDAQATRHDRKRAIVLDALQQAAEVGSDGVIESLSERYVDDCAEGTEERHRAERLYRRALLGRAFRRIEKGRLAEARKDFDDVYRRTGAYEAVVGSIDLRLRQGETPAAIAKELDGTDPASAHANFVRAYLLACELENRSGEAHAQAVYEARELLRRSWSTLKNEPAARSLHASIMHEAFLRNDDPANAESANSHYLVALSLARNDPRYQAMILGQLGLLHKQVGNYRIALDYLEQRAKLPFQDDVEAFAVRIALADALLHVGRDDESAAFADQALALLDRVPSLAEFRALALDRAALSNLAAGRFERALGLYDAEVPLLPAGNGTAALRNRFVVRLARAAASVGAKRPLRALNDLDTIEPLLENRPMIEALVLPDAHAEHVERSYASIVSGLRANAHLALGQLAEAGAALERRRQMFVLRLKSSDREEDARGLILVEIRLAENASARADLTAAGKWLDLALWQADGLATRMNEVIDPDQLHVLRVAAELSLLGKVPLTFDLPTRISDSYDKMLKQRAVKYRGTERWFEIYLAMLQGNRGLATSAPAQAQPRTTPE